MPWTGRWTWASVLLLAQACFDPNDNELPATETETSSTGASATVSATEADTTDSSPSDPSDSGTAGSIDTSASTDPDTTSVSATTEDTTSATTTVSTTESGEGDSTTMGVVPGPCDTFDPMCPEGFKCTVWASDGGDEWDEMFCLPLDPSPVEEGEPCMVEGGPTTGIDNCDAGLVCWNVDLGTDVGTCLAFCTGDLGDPMCGAASTCVQYNSDLINLCLPYCDPLLQDCPLNQACYPVNEGFICALDASGGQGQFGDDCDFINGCDPGLFCGNQDIVPNCAGGGAGCCSTFCDVTDVNASANCPGAAGGQECIAYYEEGLAPPGFDDVGVCAIPA